MMNYYEVYVSDASYRGNDPLTYSHSDVLKTGQLVSVPLKQATTLAIVIKATRRPRFATKPVIQVYDLPCLPDALIKLLDWIRAYYAASIGSTTPLAVPTHLTSLATATQAIVNPPIALPSHKLTTDQQQALQTIDTPGTYLLHGQTGSGKTRIYIELTRQAIESGASAIILTPEISLTAQIVDVFTAIFGSRVVVTHSHMTPVQRRNIWLQLIASSEPRVVIGPRSALFMPLQKVGFIAVDEEHENSYKQEQSPHYHAVLTASQLGRLHNCRVVLGSATPSVSDVYALQQKQRPIISMRRIETTRATRTVVDMRDKTYFSRHNYLSDVLLQKIKQSLDQGDQALLFLNRRGTARIVMCNHCGWQATCPHCDVPLTYHGDEHMMRCHICGYHEKAVSLCPNCHNTDIIFKSIGTKALANDVAKFFPEARVQRFDTDNKTGERFEQQYSAVRSGEVDIVVGTQLLIKGLDLPRLGVIGIIAADSSLYLPDFSSGERTYQIISQAIGRVGRGHLPGTAIIQTYQPESPLILAAVNDDWQTFYQTELQERQHYKFPPYWHLLQLTCRRKSRASAERAAGILSDKLRIMQTVTVEGPTPAFHEQSAAGFTWQLVIKAKRRQDLISIASNLPSGWNFTIDPSNLL